MYTNKFSNYLKKKKELIKELIKRLGEEFEYASCLVTDVKGTSVRVNKNVTSVNPSSLTESGFVIRVRGKNLYTEYSINEINEKNLDEVVEKVKSLANTSYTSTIVNSNLIADETLQKVFVRKNPGKDYKVDEIIDIAKNKVNEYLKKGQKLVNINLAVECNETSKMFISKHRELTQYYTWTNVTCLALAKEEDNFKDCYAGNGYPSLEEGINDIDNLLTYATTTAVLLLKAKPPVPGVYTVITNPSITGLIAHEAFGHGVEMDMFVKDRAKSKEYINKYVASELVSMHDGASSTLSAASYFFDDDGVLAHDTLIIDKGVLKTGISDALSAAELGTIPTGNGRRQSYKRKAYTRMTNTFFEGGTNTLEEMVASVDYGYMIFDTNNGMEDPKNWGIQCTALYGKEIKDGKFTGNIISPVVMSGYVIDLLTSISMISKDVVVTGSGSCGKGYKEWVRVSDGGACLKAKVKIG